MSAPDLARSITLTRIVGASASDVYKAWTEASAMQCWQGEKVESDARIGGRYRVEMKHGDATFVHAGEYRVLETGRRVVRTFEHADANDYRDEQIEIVLRPLDSERTEMRFIDSWNGDPLDDAGEEALMAAWSAWLEGLQALFSRKAMN